MDPMMRYPRLLDLEPAARRRIPNFVFAYLESGTGRESACEHNRRRYEAITLTPRLMKADAAPDTSTRLFGQDYAMPLGVAPIGLSSMIWPGSERVLARSAKRNGFAYALSTVAGEPMERVAPMGGEMTWFQLYVPHDRAICRDLLRRARECGVRTLVLTADVPAPSRREKMRLAGAPLGSRAGSLYSPRVIWQAALRPRWALGMLARGGLKFGNMEVYRPDGGSGAAAQFIGTQLNGNLDWKYLDEIRKIWPHRILLKGVLDPADAKRAIGCGCDGLVISNHGGRQLDAAPHPIDRLPLVRRAVGKKVPLVVDGGVTSGLDVARAIACGADFVLLGRAFMYAVVALGRRGGEHAAAVLREELVDVMAQLGVKNLAELGAVEVTGRHGERAHPTGGG